MVALPFAQVLEALTLNWPVVWVLHFLAAVAFGVAADLARCRALNGRAVIMDYFA